LPYIIPAGEVRRFPGWLAGHGLKHLIDRLITKSGKKTNNVVLRQEWAEKIVMSVESLQQKRDLSEAELLAQKIKDINQPSDLEVLLSKRAAKEEVSQKEEPRTEVIYKKEAEEEKKEEEKQDTPKEVKAVPTRQELLDYAKDKLKMNMDEKTIKKLKTMTIPTLINELGYPMD
jgi:hypothetical protein